MPSTDSSSSSGGSGSHSDKATGNAGKKSGGSGLPSFEMWGKMRLKEKRQSQSQKTSNQTVKTNTTGAESGPAASTKPNEKYQKKVAMAVLYVCCLFLLSIATASLYMKVYWSGAETETHHNEIMETLSGIKPQCPKKSKTRYIPRGFHLLPHGSVVCDTVSDGGAWIVFQRRLTDDLLFNKYWRHYVWGFGDLRSSYWLGLAKIFDYCGEPKRCELHIDMRQKEDGGRKLMKYHATYSSFWVGPAPGYQLTVSGYSGNSGDSLSAHSGAKFSARDLDQDNNEGHDCAGETKRGYWYTGENKICMTSHLNGRMVNSTNLLNKTTDIFWNKLATKGPIIFTEMKMRSNDWDLDD